MRVVSAAGAYLDLPLHLKYTFEEERVIVGGVPPTLDLATTKVSLLVVTHSGG